MEIHITYLGSRCISYIFYAYLGSHWSVKQAHQKHFHIISYDISRQILRLFNDKHLFGILSSHLVCQTSDSACNNTHLEEEENAESWSNTESHARYTNMDKFNAEMDAYIW